LSFSSLLLASNPKANYLAHKDEIDRVVNRVLSSGWYILGQEVTNFEQKFACYLGLHYGIGVGSGTDALHLALRACGVGPGDLVNTVSHTAVATVAAIELAGAVPILVDIDQSTFTMDPNHLEDSIKKHISGRHTSVRGRLKAIIPVHLYGHPANMPAIMDIARRYDLFVIEDCAQSHGAVFQGKKTGTWGHMAAFSFYPTKNLGALGDGGIVVTNDTSLAERTRMLREYGWSKRYISALPGMNSRLDEIQAAILQVKLCYLDKENARRREIAQVYTRLLADSALGLPCCQPGAEHVYHQYVVRTPKRDALQKYLKGHSIATQIHYPLPVHQQPAYRGRLKETGSLPNTEKAAAEVLSLPMYPELSNEDVMHIAESIHRYFRRSKA